MSAYTENQSWIVQIGDRIIQKKALVGLASLNDWEGLVYCLWAADYMMRNAGDFANAQALYPTFQEDAKQLAGRLGLTTTIEAFSLSELSLQENYFDLFESMCNEIKTAESKAA